MPRAGCSPRGRRPRTRVCGRRHSPTSRASNSVERSTTQEEGNVKRLPTARAARLLLLGGVVALASAVAAYGASTRGAAAPTLVVDRSFEIKTSDPQRAFEPTAAIVDRGVYDTLFT